MTPQRTIDRYVHRIELLTGIEDCCQQEQRNKHGKPVGRVYVWVDRYRFEPFLYGTESNTQNMQDRVTMRPSELFIPSAGNSTAWHYRDRTYSQESTIKQLDRLLTALQQFDRAHPRTAEDLRIEQQLL